MEKGALKAKLNSAVTYVKTHWDKPGEGEYVSLKEMTSFGVAQVGNHVFTTVGGLLAFGATFFCGQIMKLQYMDFYKISVLGTIVSYILIFMNPIGVLIYENHGVLEPKTKRLAITVWTTQILVGIGCYFLPKTLFESIPRIGMIALPQILGNILVVGGVNNFVNWYVRWKFCAKHGRLRPFILLYGVPSAILMSIIPFITFDNVEYSTKLVILHLLTSVASYFYNSHINVGGLIAFMTPNSQERQKMYSIIPIFVGLVPSIISLFFPILIGLTGGYTSVTTYRVFTPIFSVAGVAISLFAVNCKERIIENKKVERNVHFLKGAKNVLKNKYLWITNLSGLLGVWATLFASILQWWFIYSLRMEWFSGIAANIIVTSMTIGHILTPILTKRFQKRSIYLGARIINLGMVFIMYAALKINSVVLFMFAMWMRNGSSPVESGVGSGMYADIMDYHQWKYGERCDSMAGVFSWFLNPINLAIGYILPALLQSIGFTSDWDILYNQEVLTNLFNIYIVLSVICMILGAMPYLFFDLTTEKHDLCIAELKARLQREAEARGEQIGATNNEIVEATL